MSGFVRFEGTVPNGHGHHPGVFALANGLARHGILDDTDAVWLRAANDCGERTYPDPSRLDAGVFDRTINPGAQSYFRDDATDLIGMVGDYLHVLDRYGIPHRTPVAQPGSGSRRRRTAVNLTVLAISG